MEIFNTHKRGNLAFWIGKLGISKGHLCNILAGRRRPSPELAKALYSITGVAIDVWLFPAENLNPQIEKFKRTIKKVHKRKEKKK